MKKMSKSVLGYLLLALFISLACRLPFGSSSNEPTSTAAETLQVESVPVPSEQLPSDETYAAEEALPPALIETDPAPGSVVSTEQRFTFTFNQPVKKDSVAASLSTDIQTDLTLDWMDPQTLFISLADPLPSGQSITFNLAAGIQAENGLASDAAREVSYQTAGPLLLTDFYPQTDAGPVDPSGVLMAAFNQPVVALGESSDIAAFTISPPVEGEGEWLNTSTYIFRPDPALGGGVTYTVSLNQDLTSQWGSPLTLASEQSLQNTFMTAQPRLLGISPGSGETIPLDSTFVLTFNQSMDAQSVIEGLSLQDEQGEDVAIEMEWNEEASIFTIQPVQILDRNSEYDLILLSSTSSLGGTSLSAQESAHYRSVDVLDITGISPALSAPLDIYSGYASIQIQFNAPLAEDAFEEIISFTPALVDTSFYLNNESSLVAAGYFQGNTTYKLTIAPSLQDRWGGALGSPYTIEFTTAAARSQLNIPLLQYGEQVLYMTPQDTTLQAQAINLPGVNTWAAALTLDRVIKLIEDPARIIEDVYSSEAQSWRQELPVAAKTSQTVALSFKEDGQTLEPGLYAYQYEAAELEYDPQPFLLAVSNLHLTIKRSENQLFVWVLDVRTGLPAADFDLNLYIDGKDPYQSVTDSDGRCEFVLPENTDPYLPLVVASGNPGEEDFAFGYDRWITGISGWNFGLNTYRFRSDTFAYLYSDRSIYRPGQEVNFRVIVRQMENARYFPADLEMVHVDVYGDYQVTGNEIPLLGSVPITLSEFGSGSGSFQLPADASPGYYSLRVREIEESLLNFSVAEYRKPEIDLQVNFVKSEWLMGEDISAQVQAEYYFGAAAGGTDFHWAAYVQSDDFSLPFGYQTGDHAFYWLDRQYLPPFLQPLGTFVAEGEGRTDAAGGFSLKLSHNEIQPFVKTGTIQRLNIEVTIKDESGNPVSARGSTNLHPEQYYIGVKPEQWSGSAGMPLGFAIQTAGWDKSAAAGIPLRAELRKVRWLQSTDPVSGFRQSIPEYSHAGGVNLVTDNQGQARIELLPEEPGTYLLVVTGGNASTEILTWVGGAGSAAWPNLPNQQLPLTLDQETYTVGDTALLFIPNPFEQALALITVERADVMRSYVQKLNQPSLNFPLQILEEDAPNIYVSVTLVTLDRTNGLDFRQGYATLEVAPESLLLQVDLTTDSEFYAPGSPAILNLLVNGPDGSPVEGEFSVSLVDKAVLALAAPNSKDIQEAFYGTQALGVQTSIGLAAYVGRFPSLAADGIGGGGGEEREAPSVRQEFKDTAFWNGSIRTDSDGRASVQVDLPDNLTTWVVTVRGLDAAAKVGQTQAEVLVTKGVLVRPVVPRFLVTGDELDFGAVVNNNTGENLPVDVSVQVSGISLDADSAENQRVIVESGSSVRVNWRGTVQSVAQVEMIFSAASGDFNDITTPEGGAIPVLHYVSPQTFGTSGVLTDQSEVLESVSFPRRGNVQGGQLLVELAPSLAATILEELKALDAYPYDHTEAILSRLLPNLAMLDAIQIFDLSSPAIEEALSEEITSSIDRLDRLQTSSGGWGWSSGTESDRFISSYVLLGLTKANEQGFFVDAEMLTSAQDYLQQNLPRPGSLQEHWQLDRLVFQYYALTVSGISNLDSEDLEPYKDQLNPWARALLVLMRVDQYPGDETLANGQNDVQALASQTASGTYWEESHPDRYNFSSTLLNTAVSVYAIARIDPDSSLLTGGVRYLAAHRQPPGGWGSSYQSAWVLMALIEAMKASGELQAQFTFSASLNGEELIQGSAGGIEQMTSIQATAPYESLYPDAPNALRIRKDAGTGKLYYRAYLQADTFVEVALPIQRGLSVERKYTLWNADCSYLECQAIEQYSLGDLDTPVEVLVSITVPDEMFYVVVEDWLPAGTEVVNLGLLTSQQGSGKTAENIQSLPEDPANLAGRYFEAPQIYDDHIRWIARQLPAGTYVLSYRMTPYLAGNFRVIPARAYQYYFPEVEGTSAGRIFTIEP